MENSITKKLRKAKWDAENKERKREYQRKYNELHKAEIAEQRKRYRQANQEIIKKYGREYFLAHQEELKMARRKDPEEIRLKKEERHTASVIKEKIMAAIYREKNKERISEYHKQRRKAVKLKVISGYGGKCACCGENTYEFLAIDHVNGGGNKMRKNKIHPDGYQFLKWIIENNFPAEFQLLCHNCNMAKGILGYCPHEKIRSIV